MAHTPSDDDRLGDFFGRLPAPQSPHRLPQTPTGGGSERPDAGEADQPGDHPVGPVSDGPAEPAPMSRRAAREAAARSAESGPVPVAQPGGEHGAAPQTEHAPIAAPVEAPRAAPVAGSAHAPEASAPRPATLDSLFDEGREAHVTRGRHDKDRRKSRIAGWVIFGVILALLGGVTAGGLWVWNTYESQIRSFMGWEEPKDFEPGMATGEVVVTIAEGDNPSDVSATLFEAGVTKTKGAFYSYLIDNALNPTLYPGAFKLQKQMTSEAALAALENPDNKLENTAQLREGLTVATSLPLLAEGTGIPLADFEAAVADPSVYGVDATSLEGWLFPATYRFEPGVTAEDVIRTLVDRTVASLDSAGVPAADRHRVLTIASIIEREARYQDDFFKVSRVIQNRLDIDMKLQMDSTAQYGFGQLHDGQVSSSAEALADDNEWNTYVHTGLPKGPIANPGDLAIDAAMHPADGPWLYFVTVNLETGETVFSETYAEHLRAVEQWRDWCADNPNGGC